MKKFVAVMVMCCLLFTLCSCKSTTSYDSLEDYLKTDAPLIYSELLTFPDKSRLDEDAVELYRSETVRTLLFDDVYFLLRCKYEQQEYEQEILRLNELGAQYYENMFHYPAYVMLYYGLHYEYALVDEENYTIVYVYAMASGFHSDETMLMFDDFPAEYMPVGQPKEDIVVYEYE